MCPGCGVINKLRDEENFVNRNFLLIKSSEILDSLPSDKNGFKSISIDDVRPISDSCSYFYKIYYIITNLHIINYQIF